jgi:hypothetical protein
MDCNLWRDLLEVGNITRDILLSSTQERKTAAQRITAQKFMLSLSRAVSTCHVLDTQPRLLEKASSMILCLGMISRVGRYAVVQRRIQMHTFRRYVSSGLAICDTCSSRVIGFASLHHHVQR